MALAAGTRGFWASSQLETVNRKIDGSLHAMDWWTTANATARLVNADCLLWVVELPMRVQLVGPADQLVLSSSHAASVALDACRRRVSKRRRGYSTQAIKMRRRLVSPGFSSATLLTPKSRALLLRCDGGFFFFDDDIVLAFER